MKKIYQILLSLSISFLLLLSFSCDLNSPVDIALLEISEELLDFGLFDTEMEFTVTNSDTASALWDIRVWPGWISVDPEMGTLARDAIETIKVSVDRGDLEPGEYSGDIYVEIQGVQENLYVQVYMEINPIPIYSPQNQNLSSTDVDGEFTIENRGNYELKWKVYSLQDWLDVEPDSGATDPFANMLLNKDQISRKINAGSTVTFDIDRTLLDPGLHVGIIEIESIVGTDSVYVTVPQDEDPLLSVSNTQLSFDENNTTRTITIDNVGGGILSWQAESSDDWVTIEPDHGDISTQALLADLSKYNIITRSMTANEMQVEISVRIAELDPGTITSSVNISSNGGHESIGLTIDVLEHPELGVSNDELDFGTTGTTESFNILNLGTGILDWSITPSHASLSVTPSTGSTQSSETVTVDLDRTLLDNTGQQTFTLNITSDGGDKSIDVLVNVLTPPQLSFSPDLLEFNDLVGELPLHIENLGQEILNWEMIPTVGWLLFSENPGSHQNSEARDVIVMINPEIILPPGNHEGKINIQSNGGSGSVDINLNVPEDPVLQVTPPSLEFGDAEIVKDFDINNTGSGTLNWIISVEEDWISIDSNTGDTTTETDKITVTIDRTGLRTGDYIGYIIISSDVGTNTVEVRMSVSSNPILAVSENEIDFGTSSTHEIFFVKNEGNDRILWDATIEYLWEEKTSITKETIGWLTLEPASGNTASEQEVNAYADRYLLNIGLNEAIIHITSNGGDIDIPVSITADSPVLELSTYQLNFGNTDTERKFDVINDGGQILDWASSIYYMGPNGNTHTTITTPPWLSLSPEYDNTTDKTTVTATAYREFMPPGIHNAIIYINSNGGNKDINVEITVPSSSVGVYPLYLDFGTSETEKTFEVKNEGGSTLSYQIAPDDIWISVDPAGGYITTGKDVIKVYVDREFVTANFNMFKESRTSATQYTGTIQIQNLDDVNNHQTVEVTMTISPPQIGVDPLLLDFGENETEKTFDIKNIGSGTLNYSFWTQDYWISLSAYSGSVENVKDVITVNVIRGDLTKQKLNMNNSANKFRKSATTQYTGYINIENVDDQYDTEIIEVRMTVPDPPILDVTPTVLAYGNDSGYVTQELSIQNLGEDVCNWIIIIEGDAAIHVNIDSDNGTTTTETDIVNVTVNRELEPGTYNATIVIYSDGGDQFVPVTWTVL